MKREILHDLGFFGHYLHIHAGGRGGKQFVLAVLHKSGGKLTQRELLEHTNISPAALSEVLAKLEGEGLIARKPCTHDRRQLTIELTQAGKVKAACMRKKRDEFEQQAFACLDQREQEQLKDLLDRLVVHWKKLEDSEVNE
ncbi:MAG: MarR family transcriptional regulator [Atopobiaceae bacterium]|nr:MarR family transcriptional regulator [Atopobiaceae bacterium]